MLRNAMRTEKIYTVKISDEAKGSKGWYSGKIGREFETRLSFRLYNYHNTNGYAVFEVIESPAHWILPEHCTVIKETIKQ